MNFLYHCSGNDLLHNKSFGIVRESGLGKPKRANLYCGSKKMVRTIKRKDFMLHLEYCNNCI